MNTLQTLILYAAIAADPQYIGPVPVNPTGRPSGGSIGTPGEYAGVAGIVEGDDEPAERWEPEPVEEWEWWFMVWSWIWEDV